MRPVHRRALSVTLIAAFTLAAAACKVPLNNAPPGGGATVTQTFYYGPFTLGPGEEVMGSPSSGVPRPTGAFGLKGATFDVVDETGTPISSHDVHLHHFVLTTSARQDQLCPGRRERFLGSGMERTPVHLPDPYAYLVTAGEQWGAIYHIMNETPPGTPAKTVRVKYTLEYQPGANATNSRAVDVYFQDTTGCGNSTYDVPGNGGPGSVHVNSRSWTAPEQGIAVYTGGHLHDGGIDISLRNDTQQYTLCTGVVTYHENPHHLATINPCPLHNLVRAGDVLTVAARYDNSRPWADVMGIMMTWIWWGSQQA
jgi:hypothetical protein